MRRIPSIRLRRAIRWLRAGDWPSRVGRRGSASFLSRTDLEWGIEQNKNNEDSPPMAKSTLSFVCQNCGAAYNRWQGKCESCGEWNTLAEEDTTGATTMPVSIRSKRKGRLFALETLTGKSVEAPRLPS